VRRETHERVEREEGIVRAEILQRRLGGLLILKYDQVWHHRSDKGLPDYTRKVRTAHGKSLKKPKMMWAEWNASDRQGMPS
jgi:hypothetical protein